MTKKIIALAMTIFVFAVGCSESETVISSPHTAAVVYTPEVVSDTQSVSESVSNTQTTTQPEIFDDDIPQTEIETTQEIVAAADLADDDFVDDLFIGDSIATGFYLYGYVDKRNVFADVGLSPGAVLTAAVDGQTLADKLSAIEPKNIYIMIGTNGIGYLTPDNMASNVSAIVKHLSQTAPGANIVVLSISPVTQAREAAHPQKMADINAYNALLSQVAAENGVQFSDVGALLKDDTGYFDAQYAEADGLHFKSAAYKVVLGHIKERNI
ncbi:MAG: SGNH/GDSL hydrolase family protein [Oscillospiraceae bacterium]|nr:SGNH/GDSL hydrolase family protein [Oscillospiraceae bacterium]